MMGLAAAGLLAAAGDALAQRRGDQATTVDPLEVVAPMVPVPNVGEGAPMFSAAELEAAKTLARREAAEAASNSRRCNSDGMRLGALYRQENKYAFWKLFNDESVAKKALMTAADRASKASEAAVAARRDAALGKVGQDAVERTELARQAAVNDFLKKRNAVLEIEATIQDRYEVARERIPDQFVTMEMMARADERFVNGGAEAVVLGREASSRLVLAEVQASDNDSARRPTFVIRGRIDNPSDKAVRMPALTFVAVDQFGGALETKVADPGDRVLIPAGGSAPFSYAFAPKPRAARTVLVAFADDRQEPAMMALGMVCGDNGGEL